MRNVHIQFWEESNLVPKFDMKFHADDSVYNMAVTKYALQNLKIGCDVIISCTSFSVGFLNGNPRKTDESMAGRNQVL